MQRNVRGVLKLCRVSISRKGNLIMQMTTGIQREKNIRAEYEFYRVSSSVSLLQVEERSCIFADGRFRLWQVRGLVYGQVE